MSGFDGLDDKDFELKLKIMQLFWKQGSFVRPNIKLYDYIGGKRARSITDIDVIAIKPIHFQPHMISICSAKSGKESDKAQMFWLSGVMHYFNADKAYYISSKANLKELLLLSDKLEITSIDNELLDSLNTNAGESEKQLSIFSVEGYKKVSEYFENLKNVNKYIYNYITEYYWIDRFHSQLLKSFFCAKDIDNLQMDEETKLFFKYYCITLFSIPLITISNLLSTTHKENQKNELSTILMGGRIGEVEKRIVIRKYHQYIVNYIEKNYKEKYDFTEEEFTKYMTFIYLDELHDLINRLTSTPFEALNIPLLLDIITFEIIMQKKEYKLEDLNSYLPSIKLDMKTLKLAKDVLNFFERCKVTTASEIEPVLKIVS